MNCGTGQLKNKCHASYTWTKISLNFNKRVHHKAGFWSTLVYTKGTPFLGQSHRSAQLTKWMSHFHNFRFPSAGVTGRRKAKCVNQFIHELQAQQSLNIYIYIYIYSNIDRQLTINNQGDQSFLRENKICNSDELAELNNRK